MEKELPDYQLEQLKKIKKTSKTNRRGFFNKITLGLGSALAAGFYLKFEANWLEITRKQIQIPTLKNKSAIKILHLSDLHFSDGDSLENIDTALREGFALSPDACVITGDFITHQISDQDILTLGKCLKKYSLKVPTFATLGNHDGGSWAGKNGGPPNTKKVEQMLSHARIKLLHNQRESIYLKGQALSITGVGDLWSQTCIPDKCLPTP